MKPPIDIPHKMDELRGLLELVRPEKPVYACGDPSCPVCGERAQTRGEQRA